MKRFPEVKIHGLHIQSLYTCFMLEGNKVAQATVELQWLEHRWLVYHGFFELVLDSLGKNLIASDIIIFRII